MLERVLEPEVMDTEEDALEYQGIDNDEVNREFVDCILELAPQSGSLLDVGAGPGDIPVLIATRAPGLEIVAIDLAKHMLALAHEKVARAGLKDRVRIECADAKATGFANASFDMIVCNSLVHHIPDPELFFREVSRLSKPGAGIFIKDLLRPSTQAALDELVVQHAANCSPYQRRLFADSLHAALTLDDVASLCRLAGLEDVLVRQTSDRHWTIERPAQERKNRS